MKKILVTVIAAMTLMGCYNDPQSTKIEGNGIKVEFMFEHDSIKVYRFHDGGHYHYFTNRGETMGGQSHGKYNREENIK